MFRLILRLCDLRFARYVVASVGALAVDMGSFLLLLRLGAAPAVAAFLGYSLGMVANWLLLSRGVFGDGMADRGRARSQQKALFVITTLFGLGITTVIVSAAAAVGANLIVTKGIAVAVSFTFNWFARKHLVFEQTMPAVSRHGGNR